jgi:plasmid stability protein
MGDLLIRDIPEDLKRELSEIARRAGRSTSETAKAIIEKAVADHRSHEEVTPGRNAYEELRAIFADIPDAEREAFAEIMNEVEAQRKPDFGRPFSFGE